MTVLPLLERLNRKATTGGPRRVKKPLGVWIELQDGSMGQIYLGKNKYRTSEHLREFQYTVDRARFSTIMCWRGVIAWEFIW